MMTINCKIKWSIYRLEYVTAFFAYQIKDINVIFEQFLERDNELLVETGKTRENLVDATLLYSMCILYLLI